MRADLIQRPSQLVVSGLLTIGVAACGAEWPADPTPTRLDGPPPIVLPGGDELVPAGTAAVGGWIGTRSFPETFDPNASHPDAEGIAEALAEALGASFARAPERPTYELSAVDEQQIGRSLLVITELGAGDDSVAGTQYAIVAEQVGDGWRLAELYARAVCRRGLTGGLCL